MLAQTEAPPPTWVVPTHGGNAFAGLLNLVLAQINFGFGRAFLNIQRLYFQRDTAPIGFLHLALTAFA